MASNINDGAYRRVHFLVLIPKLVELVVDWSWQCGKADNNFNATALSGKSCFLLRPRFVAHDNLAVDLAEPELVRRQKAPVVTQLWID